MQQTLAPYLSFNGNCQTAMQHYQYCLGGTLQLQTIADSPLARELPDSMQAFILTAILQHQQLVLMGTDLVEGNCLGVRTPVSLYLLLQDEAELRKSFARLAEGGLITQPLKHNHAGQLSGELTDRFGYHWMLAGPPAQLS
jgi:PhnB protein